MKTGFTIDFTKVGQHIKTARTEANKTQKEVALACGCDPKHISAVETGKTNPSIDLLTMLSEELNVSVDYFLKDAPNAYIGYWEAEEFKPLFEAMTPATRSALIPIMKSLLAVQNAAAATE